jgi:hypothetical protein
MGFVGVCPKWAQRSARLGTEFSGFHLAIDGWATQLTVKYKPVQITSESFDGRRNGAAVVESCNLLKSTCLAKESRH